MLTEWWIPSTLEPIKPWEGLEQCQSPGVLQTGIGSHYSQSGIFRQLLKGAPFYRNVVKMVTKRGGKKKAKVNVGRVKVKPWDLTTGCHIVAPFIYSSPLLPPHQPVLKAELFHISPLRLPVLGKPSCASAWGLTHFSHIAFEAPTLLAEVKPQDPWGSSSASSSDSFSLTVLWSHGLPCCSSNVPIIFLSHCLCTFVPSTGNVLFYMFPWLISFKSVIRCHLLRGAWPSDPHQPKELPLSLSFLLLCCNFLPISLGIILLMHQIIVWPPLECKFHEGRDLECFVHCCIPWLDQDPVHHRCSIKLLHTWINSEWFFTHPCNHISIHCTVTECKHSVKMKTSSQSLLSSRWHWRWGDRYVNRYRYMNRCLWKSFAGAMIEL